MGQNAIPQINPCERFEVLTTVMLKTPIFWDVKLCHLVNTSQNFKEM
jgi:hypothetical protein